MLNIYIYICSHAVFLFAQDVPTADVTAEGTVDTAGPPPSPALEPPSLDDDKPHPEQDIAIVRTLRYSNMMCCILGLYE